MISSEWLNDPALNEIPNAKEKMQYLLMILQATQQSNTQKPSTIKEMLPFLMTIRRKAEESNISFEKEELQKILLIMEKYASPEELKKLEVLSSYFR